MRRLERKIRHSWLQRTRRRNFHVVMCHDSCMHVLLDILKSIEVTGSIIIQYSLNFQGTKRRSMFMHQSKTNLQTFLLFSKFGKGCIWNVNWNIVVHLWTNIIYLHDWYNLKKAKRTNHTCLRFTLSLSLMWIQVRVFFCYMDQCHWYSPCMQLHFKTKPMSIYCLWNVFSPWSHYNFIRIFKIIH